MKPTQQEIIELAREAGIPLGSTVIGYTKTAPCVTKELECLVHLALERFGAGGGEPVAWMYFESDGDAIFGHPNGYRPSDAVPVYTHPSPTDLQAVRDKALEDAARMCSGWTGGNGDSCAELIRTLKGKP